MKNELKRAFTSKGMIISLIIAVIINVLYIQEKLSVAGEYYSNIEASGIYDMFTLSTPFEIWIISAPSKYSIYYYYMFPLLAVLPFGASYCLERKSGYIKNSLVRQRRSSYMGKKYAAAFLSGGFAAFCPSLLNFLWIFTYRAYQNPVPESPQNFIFGGTLIGDMYYTHPFVVAFIYLFMEYLFGGTVAVAAVFISKFTDNMYTVLIMPMFLTMFITMVVSSEYSRYLYTHLMEPLNGNGAYVIPGLAVCVAVLAVLYVITVCTGRKKDCF